MERSTTVLSEGTEFALNELEDMLNESTPPLRKVSMATQEALDYVDGKLKVDTEEDDLPPTPDPRRKNVPEKTESVKAERSVEKTQNQEVKIENLEDEVEAEPGNIERVEKPEEKKTKLEPPIDKGRQSILYVLTAEERAILFQGRDFENERKNREEKSVLTCALFLMFEEMEHQPIVYEKLMTSELFDESLKSLSSEQNLLLKKILERS